MKIGFVVNDVNTEQTGYTTTRLGMWAINRGHEVWVIGLGDFAYDPDENIKARAYSVPKKNYKTTETYLKALQSKTNVAERITVDDLDIPDGCLSNHIRSAALRDPMESYQLLIPSFAAPSNRKGRPRRGLFPRSQEIWYYRGERCRRRRDIDSPLDRGPAP